MQRFPNASPFMYSKYQELKSVLQDPTFMAEGTSPDQHLCVFRSCSIIDRCYSGGDLGFYCEHRYAHTNEHFINRLPYALKGNDAVIFSILLRGFGFKVFLRPILEDLDMHRYSDDEDKEVGDLVATTMHPLELSSEGDDEMGRVSEVCNYPFCSVSLFPLGQEC